MNQSAPQRPSRAGAGGIWRVRVLMAILSFVLSVPVGVYRWMAGLMPFMRKSRAKVIPDGYKVIPQSGNLWLEVNFSYNGRKPRHPLVGRLRILRCAAEAIVEEPLVESDTWATNFEPESNDRFRVTIATAPGSGSEFYAVGPVSQKYDKWADPDLRLQGGLYRVEIVLGAADLKETLFTGELVHTAGGFRFSGLRRNRRRLEAISEPELASLALATFPAEAGIAIGKPDWLVEAAKHDSEQLAESLFDIGESQYGHIGWGLDNEHQPCLVLEFRYVNASVYNVLATTVEGSINVVGENELAGGWKFQPTRLPRNRATRLRLRWVIDNDVSVNHLKRLVKENETIWIEMGRLKVSIEAEEDSSIKAELRYPHQQIWQRSYDPPQAPDPDATEEESK